MQDIDADLIARCLNKDEKALHTLYRECYSLMKGIALRYVFDREDVSDVMNRGFVKVVKGLESYNAKKKFAPWVATVLINESLDYVRRTMRRKEKEANYREEIGHINRNAVDYNLAAQQLDADYLLRTLDVLSPKTRVVFNMYAIDGYSHKDIAKKLKISEGTSKWHVSNARELLQQELKKQTESGKIALND